MSDRPRRPEVRPGDAVRVLARAGQNPQRPPGQTGVVLPPGHLTEWETDPAAEPATRVIAVQSADGTVVDATSWEVAPAPHTHP